MPMVLRAEPDPSTDLLEEMAALAPENPFYTSAYAEAMRLRGLQPWALAVQDGDRLVSACTAFLKKGRISCLIEIPSLPVLGQNAPPFWDGLFRLCRRARIGHVSVNTYASEIAEIPADPVPARLTDRTEYIIDLRQADLWRPVRQSHRSRINRARKAGLQLRSSSSEDDCGSHARVMTESMRRRAARGERVADSISEEPLLVFLTTGAGLLFQAVLDGQVLSSALVLISSSGRGAYDQSSGTSPEGMERGASHFLLWETARNLQERGFSVFNLGGVSEVNPGLREFKAGFGANQRSLAAAEFDLRTGLRRTVEGVVQGLRGRLARLVSS
jgi:hypothetical protein